MATAARVSGTRKRSPGRDEHAMAAGAPAEVESLKDESRDALDEARMVLPGIQAVFGFQLIAVFSERFEHIGTDLKAAHLVALALIVVSIALIMAPAAYDRIAQREVVSRRFIDLTSRLMTWAMVPLLLAIATELFVVMMLVTGSAWVSVVATAIAVALYGWLWFALPLSARGAQDVRRHR